MSSSFSRSTPSQMQSSTPLSSTFSSSSTSFSVPLSTESSASVLALPTSETLDPFPSPSPSITPVFQPSPPPPSSPPPSPTESSSFSSTILSSESSVISSTEPFDVSSANLTTFSSSSLGTTLSESTSAVANDRSTLRPVEITAIVLGIVTAILGIIAVLLIFWFRRKRHRHHQLYGLPFAKENKVSNQSSRNDVEARETLSGRLYFHSSYEQKGTTPLLQHSVPNNSDFPHDEPYKDTELNHISLPLGSPSSPLQSSSRHEVSAHLKTPVRSPRSPPPPHFQDNSRPLLSLTIPEFIAPNSIIASFMTSTQGSDTLSRADTNESGEADGDSPSVYSQPSTNLLSRGPSVTSHVSVRRFSVPPIVLESIVAGGSPTEENVRYDVDEGSEDSGETITSATMAGPASESPPDHGLNPNSQMRRHSHLNENSGPHRQNTTAVASLLKSRHRQSELLPIAPSDVSHIERAGSIRTAHGVMADDAGEGYRATDGREPYGRRFRRMKAEQENSGMAT